MHQCFQMNRLDGLCTKIYFYHRKRDSFGNLDQFGIALKGMGIIFNHEWRQLK